MPVFSTSDKYVMLSASFIDRAVLNADSAAIRVYLYTLAHSGEELDFDVISAHLNIERTQVEESVAYWLAQGELIKQGGGFVFVNAHSPQTTPDTASQAVLQQEQLYQAVNEDKNLSELSDIAQVILGRTLSATDMNTLYWLYDELRYSPEAILVILEYCASLGKYNMSYIERTAIAFKEKGLLSADEISSHLTAESEKHSRFMNLKQAMGITGRALSNAEEQYFAKWLDELLMSEEMIVAAYEECILKTSQLSFPYIDAILLNWSKSGFVTPADITKQKPRTNSPRKSFEHSNLEDISRYYPGKKED